MILATLIVGLVGALATVVALFGLAERRSHVVSKWQRVDSRNLEQFRPARSTHRDRLYSGQLGDLQLQSWVYAGLELTVRRPAQEERILNDIVGVLRHKEKRVFEIRGSARQGKSLLLGRLAFQLSLRTSAIVLWCIRGTPRASDADDLSYFRRFQASLRFWRPGLGATSLVVFIDRVDQPEDLLAFLHALPSKVVAVVSSRDREAITDNKTEPIRFTEADAHCFIEKFLEEGAISEDGARMLVGGPGFHRRHSGQLLAFMRLIRHELHYLQCYQARLKGATDPERDALECVGILSLVDVGCPLLFPETVLQDIKTHFEDLIETHEKLISIPSPEIAAWLLESLWSGELSNERIAMGWTRVLEVSFTHWPTAQEAIVHALVRYSAQWQSAVTPEIDGRRLVRSLITRHLSSLEDLLKEEDSWLMLSWWLGVAQKAGLWQLRRTVFALIQKHASTIRASPRFDDVWYLANALARLPRSAAQDFAEELFSGIVSNQRAFSNDKGDSLKKLFAYADFLSNRGREAKALDILKDAQRVLAFDATLLKLMGQLLNSQGQLGEALNHYRSACIKARVEWRTNPRPLAWCLLEYATFLFERSSELDKYLDAPDRLLTEAVQKAILQDQVAIRCRAAELLVKHSKINEAAAHYRAAMTIYRSRGHSELGSLFFNAASFFRDYATRLDISVETGIPALAEDIYTLISDDPSTKFELAQKANHSLGMLLGLQPYHSSARRKRPNASEAMARFEKAFDSDEHGRWTAAEKTFQDAVTHNGCGIILLGLHDRLFSKNRRHHSWGDRILQKAEEHFQASFSDLPHADADHGELLHVADKRLRFAMFLWQRRNDPRRAEAEYLAALDFISQHLMGRWEGCRTAYQYYWNFLINSGLRPYPEELMIARLEHAVRQCKDGHIYEPEILLDLAWFYRIYKGHDYQKLTVAESLLRDVAFDVRSSGVVSRQAFRQLGRQVGILFYSTEERRMRPSLDEALSLLDHAFESDRTNRFNDSTKTYDDLLAHQAVGEVQLSWCARFKKKTDYSKAAEALADAEKHFAACFVGLPRAGLDSPQVLNFVVQSKLKYAGLVWRRHGEIPKARVLYEEAVQVIERMPEAFDHSTVKIAYKWFAHFLRKNFPSETVLMQRCREAESVQG